MDIDERIRRFEELVAEDPENDMALFSLAGAYNQSGQYKKAADAYTRCTELNPTMSKAYQLAGAALMASDQADAAKDMLTRGYTIASERGDLMPKKAMEDLLERLGAPVPKVEQKEQEFPAGSFVCQKTGKPGTELPRPPFKNAMGQWIQERISKQTWDEWIGLGTKIINELRLDLSRDEHDAVYDYGMRMFIGLSDDAYTKLMGSAPPEPDGQFKGVVGDILSRGGHLEEFKGEMHKGVET